MHTEIGKHDEMRDVCALGNGVLSHLQVEHEETEARAALLERIVGKPFVEKADEERANSLLDELLDGPDDFHHFIERRLFRRLWFREGNFVPGYFDLDELHAGRRAARDAVIRLGARRFAGFWNSEATRAAAASLLNFARMQIETEEAQFYPMLRRKLIASDWAEIDEETRAYQACWRAVRRRGRAVC